MEEKTIITLTTDFGQDDPFVGIMKGVIYGINQNVHIVDISHNIPSYDIWKGGFILKMIHDYFPNWSIHLAIIDPGVGSERRPILAVTDSQYFIAPDNGILSFIYDEHPETKVIELNQPHFFLKPRGNTFHARDIFAPVAGYLALRKDSSLFGDEISDYIKFDIPKPVLSNKKIEGEILYVDKFGNLISNIPEEMLLKYIDTNRKITIKIGNLTIKGISKFYAEKKKKDFLAVVDSMGLIEIAQNQGNASKSLNLGRGAKLIVEIN